MIPISFFLFFFFIYFFLYFFIYFFIFIFLFIFFINQIIMCTCDLYIIIIMFRSNYSLSLSCTWPSWTARSIESVLTSEAKVDREPRMHITVVERNLICPMEGRTVLSSLFL